MDLFHFLLASAGVAAQAARAPVTASLAREITQSCSLDYILLYSPSPFYFFFVLYLPLSYDIIFIRGSEPLWSIDYHRLCRLRTYTVLQIIDNKIVAECDCVTKRLEDSTSSGDLTSQFKR